MSKVEWDIVVPVKMPADLKGKESGKIPDNLLRNVKGGKLHWRAADAWDAMVAAAESDGVELKPVSAGDTYRSYDSQKTAFLQRYVTSPIEGTSTRTFEGKTWYLKKGMAKLAVPGTSQHNWGIAVDVHTAAEPKRLNWLIGNVRKFGFSWEVVPEEPWHLRYTEGDNVPDAVKEWLTKNGKEVVAAAPASAEVKSTPTATNSAVDVDSLPALVKDYRGPAVKRAQRLLEKHGVQCAQDGDFGPKTQSAVKQFQQKKGLPVTGDVDKATWAALLA